MGNEIINHLMYADDLVIMAPSVTGLSKLQRFANCLVPRMILYSIRRRARLYILYLKH